MTTFEQAWQCVAVAGRELGSGPARAVPRLVPNETETREWLTARGIHGDRAGTILLGVAVGLVMAENPGALAALDQIERDWSNNR